MSSTTCSASPTESARSACSWGLVPSAGLMTGLGTCTLMGSSRCVLRERSTFRDTRATIVVSQAARLSTPLASEPAQTQPGFLDGVIGLGERAQSIR